MKIENAIKRKQIECILLAILCYVRFINADSRVESLASILREVTGQLERFNSLYITKLERELSATASRLSALESTLRSVADRAHAWDNIQNHMAVWTDQTRTMERKLDLLNRCHEKQATWESKLSAVDALNHKLTALDKKINAMTRLEFKVEKVSERVEEIDSKINYLKERTMPAVSEEPGLAHLAKRGLVSYLSTMESKLDNITKKLDKKSHHHHHTINNNDNNNNNNHHSPRIYGARARSSWTLPETAVHLRKDKSKDITECFMSGHDSQMIEDVSAKVDLLFDRMTDPDYDYKTFVGHLKRNAPSADAPLPQSHQQSDFDTTPEHVFARFWKSLFAPFKKMNRRFRTFENQLTNVERSCNGSSTDFDPTFGRSAGSGNLGKILDERLTAFDDALREEMAETRVAVGDQSSHLEKITQMQGNSAYMTEKLQAEVSQQFEAQRAVMQSRFQEIRTLVLQYCARDTGDNYTPRVPPAVPIPTVAPPTTSRSTRVSSFPKFPSETPTVRAKRPAYVRPSNFARSNRCLPKDSPLWSLPNLSRAITVCPMAKRGHHRYNYRLQYSTGPSNSTSTRTYQKSSENSIMRSYGRTNMVKRSVISNSANEIVESDGTELWDSASTTLPYEDCSEMKEEGYIGSEVYLLGNIRDYNDAGRDFYTRYCDQQTDGGGWTVIQRRGMFGYPFANFTRPWVDYKYGFGSLEAEFWWGNDFIHKLSEQQPMSIRFDLWDFEGNHAFAEYSSFKIDSEENKYRLSVSGYRGNASDSFSAHNGYYFSTYDADNDEAPECCPCAPAYGGGWWFYSCFESNLNGEYYDKPTDNEYYRGLIWELWLGDYSLKATEIKIRPSSLSQTSFPTPFPDPYPTDYRLPELP